MNAPAEKKPGEGFTVVDRRLEAEAPKPVSKNQKRKAQRAQAQEPAEPEPAEEEVLEDVDATDEEQQGAEEAQQQEEVAPPFNPYAGGIESVVLAGAAAPTCGGILCKAILDGDYTITGQAMKDLATAKKAMCFEILSLSPDVPAELGWEPGMHCYHVSASSDAVDPTDPTCRIFVVHWMDLRLVWWPPTQDAETGERVFYEAPAPKASMANVGSPASNGWPWRAEHTGKGKAWHVLDVNGEVIVSALTEKTACLIADAANARSARHDPAAPMSVSIPARESVLQAAEQHEAPRQAPPQPPQQAFDLNAALEGIFDPGQRQTVTLTLQMNGPQAALAMAEGFKVANRYQQARDPSWQQPQQGPGGPLGGAAHMVPAPPQQPWTPPNPEDVPRPQQQGGWGVYLEGQTQPYVRFNTPDEAVAWADRSVQGQRFEVTRVDQPPNWHAPRPRGPVPLTPFAAEQLTGGMGASWGGPPSSAAAELSRGTTNPLGIPTAQGRGPVRRG